MAAQRWHDAVEAYTKLARRLDRGAEPFLGMSMEIYLNRGIAARELGQDARAIEDFVTARTRWPSSV